MFALGELVKVKSTEREHAIQYLDKIFTIVGWSSYTPICYYCLHGNMTNTRIFYDEELELVESNPKFKIGSVVEKQDWNGYILGIVEQSNRLGSMVRFCRHFDADHIVQYNSNRSLKLVK